MCQIYFLQSDLEKLLCKKLFDNDLNGINVINKENVYWCKNSIFEEIKFEGKII